MAKPKINVYADLGTIILSILIAIMFADSHFLGSLLSTSAQREIIGSFIAGLFFTSIFTTAPAIVVLSELGNVQNPFIVAGVGALGSLLGDMILFKLFRNSVAKNLEFLVSKIKLNKIAIFHGHYFKWLLPFLGALVIASPLPDEIGIGMMGIAKLKTSVFVPISYVFNFVGILLILWVS